MGSLPIERGDLFFCAIRIWTRSVYLILYNKRRKERNRSQVCDDYGNSPHQDIIPVGFSEEEAFDLLAEKTSGKWTRVHVRGTQIIDIYKCYTFSLYEDSPDHVTTLGYYAVDPFGYVYEQDYLAGEYYIVEEPSNPSTLGVSSLAYRKVAKPF